MTETLSAVAGALVSKIVDSEIKIRVLEDLLIERDTITREELEDKYKLLYNRDSYKLQVELIELIREYGKDEDGTSEHNESSGDHKDDPNES